MKRNVRTGRRWMAGILAAGMLLACGCGENGEVGGAGEGKSGWNREAGKALAAEKVQMEAQQDETLTLGVSRQDTENISMDGAVSTEELQKSEPDRANGQDDTKEQDRTNEQNNTKEGERELLAYILEFGGKSMVYDEVEWVEIPSRRADELGLTDEDEGGGFMVYNEAEEREECLLAENCKCTILNWTENYVQTDVTLEQLVELLIERDASYIPYILTIADGRIVSVQEHYVP